MLRDASVDMFQWVEALANSGLDKTVCLTELIDNSLDFESSLVEIDIVNGKTLSIRDNGSGVEDLQALVRFGGHVPNKRKSGSGRYGVGFKDAVLALGGVGATIDIRTVYDQCEKRANIVWSLLKASTKCLDESEPVPVVDARQGTTIRISPLRIKFPGGADIEETVRQLAYIYSPALKTPKDRPKETREIVLSAHGKTYKLSDYRWRPPEYVEKIDQVITVGAKRARVYAGIVKDGQPNERKGLTYMHGYRVIKRASRKGCGSHSIQKFCGFVDVLSGWERSKNKNDLVDADDLYEAVELLLEPLLKKADQATHDLGIDAGIATVECALGAMLGAPTDKAKRKRGNKRGTVLPANTGRTHTTASDTQPSGTVRPRDKGRCVTLRFDHGWHEGMPHGEFSTGNRGAVVVLYDDHPWITRALHPWDGDRIYAAAAFLVAIGPDESPQLTMGGADTQSVLRSLSKMLASPVASVDGHFLDKAAE